MGVPLRIFHCPLRQIRQQDKTMATKAKPKSEVKVVKKVEVAKVVKPTKAKPKVTKAVATKTVTPSNPEFGKKYIFTSQGGEFIGAISQGDPWHKMTIYEVQNGVQTDRTIDVPDISVYTFVDDADEIFRRLSGN